MTQHIEIPEILREFAEKQAAKAGSFSEYVAALIQQDQKRAAKLALEAALLKGIDSGNPIDATDEYWDRKETELVERHANRGR